MSSTSYTKFEKRLALVAYYRWLFGVGDPMDPQSVRRYHSELNEQREGYDEEGRSCSYVYRSLSGRLRDIDSGDLLRYDRNVYRHTEALNRKRSEPITLKYFQILAALKTEHYLDRTTTDPSGFLRDLNAFVESRNKERRDGIAFPLFEESDLNKLAYWMATGSGKTLIFHLNYYQYLHYRRKNGDPIDHILLVTPNEGLSAQHIAEMRQSGIPCCRFNEASEGLLGDPSDVVKVIEITKLVEEKTGSGVRVEVAAFEGRNLVFVDEGHKGSGSEAGAWRTIRRTLADRGFTFEYSATFGQAVSSSTTTVGMEEEYGRAILVDYSYPRFYSDGYGKDYRILNLESDFNPELVETYLLANLLTFYEQVRVYEENEAVFFGDYNLMAPLMLYIGHSVTAGKTRSQLTPDDKKSLSDVQELVSFLHRVLSNEDDWVPEAVEAILEGTAHLDRHGEDLFANAFPALRDAGLTGKAIYHDMLSRLFHVKSPTGLHLVNLRSSEGEIGLRAGATDHFFGVINIGDNRNFLSGVEKELPKIHREESAQTASLFKSINSQGSTVQILVGAKKFIEGWSSWRVSTMGLMNIGRGEGPQIIQLFGRGVRLKGKNNSLKRSSSLQGSGPHPERLALLETLNIFGVRAKYMAQFREYLEYEGIDVDERETVYIDTRVQKNFLDKGLLTIRPQVSDSFEEIVHLRLGASDDVAPEIDLTPHVDALASAQVIREQPAAYETEASRRIPAELLALLNWDRLYRDIWQYCTRREYTNLLFDKETLRGILDQGCYRLICPSEMLACRRFSDVQRIEGMVLMILRTYITTFFSREKRSWEQGQLMYDLLDASDKNLTRTIEARVKRSAKTFLDELQVLLDDARLYDEEDDTLPRVYFDRHLYLPLLKEDEVEPPTVQYSPPGLNRGEWTFIRHLRDHLENDDGRRFMEEKELYLLRNQSRGHGVGFLAGDDMYFPDFILWLKTEKHQHIAFIDPKGLISGSSPSNPKVKLFEEIKAYERELNSKSNRKDVVLHAFMISQTDYETTRQSWGLSSYAEFNDRHVYFPEQDNYIGLLLSRVLTDLHEVEPDIATG